MALAREVGRRCGPALSPAHAGGVLTRPALTTAALVGYFGMRGLTAATPPAAAEWTPARWAATGRDGHGRVRVVPGGGRPGGRTSARSTVTESSRAYRVLVGRAGALWLERRRHRPGGGD